MRGGVSKEETGFNVWKEPRKKEGELKAIIVLKFLGLRLQKIGRKTKSKEKKIVFLLIFSFREFLMGFFYYFHSFFLFNFNDIRTVETLWLWHEWIDAIFIFHDILLFLFDDFFCCFVFLCKFSLVMIVLCINQS